MVERLIKMIARHLDCKSSAPEELFSETNHLIKITPEIISQKPGFNVDRLRADIFSTLVDLGGDGCSLTEDRLKKGGFHTVSSAGHFIIYEIRPDGKPSLVIGVENSQDAEALKKLTEAIKKHFTPS